MSTLRELKLRIGSVSSSEKITGAMKMISSAKVRKFEASLRKLVPFRSQIRAIMGHLLATDQEFSSPLIDEREVHNVGIVILGSDDGLCGAYNINIFKYLLVAMNDLRMKFGQGITFTLYPIGKKMRKAVGKLQGADIRVVNLPENIDARMEGKTVSDFTLELQNSFTGFESDRIEVVYMKFKSISKQVATRETLFPVNADDLADDLSSLQANKPYIFEPDANRIFNEVLPMFVLSTMQEIAIENRASEQAARIIAMQSANDNAKKLLESLNLEYNKLRQQSITTELLDILGGQIER